MSLKLVDPAAEAQALEELGNPTQGSFVREDLREIPELAAVFDRYLSQASWEDTPNGIVVIAPTTFHVQTLQRLQISMERLLGRPIAQFECRRTAQPAAYQSTDNSGDDASATGANGYAAHSASHNSSHYPATNNHQPNGRPMGAMGYSANPSGLPARNAPPTGSRLGHMLAAGHPGANGRPAPSALDVERKRRLDPPPFVRSPCFETPYQLTRRWAVSLNEGHGGQAIWIHGRPGSGKTTLLRQLHEWVGLNLRIESTDVMKFFHEWRRSLEAKDHLSFVRKYRKEVDLLILENVDELQGKVRTQQEVLFTINAILDAGGAIAVSSAKHPLELKELLEPALFSRLFSGLLLDMPKPDREFKERLWRQLMEDYGLAEYALDVMVQERLLNIGVESARKCKTLFINAIGRLSLKRSLSPSDVAELEAMHATTPVFQMQRSSGRNPSEIIDRVARLCGVGRAAILGKVKRQDISLARRFVCLALSRFNGLTNSMIAHLVEKDPSTVSHALKSVERDLQTNRNIAEQWNWICTQLGLPCDTQKPGQGGASRMQLGHMAVLEVPYAQTAHLPIA